MKRFFILAFVFTFFMLIDVYAQRVKIGFKTVNEYTTNKSDINLGYMAGDSYISCGNVSNYNNITFVCASGSYKKSKDVFSDYNSAKQFASNYENAYATLCNSNEWRVYAKGEVDDLIFDSGVLLGTSAIYGMCDNKIIFIADTPNFLQISNTDGSPVQFAGVEYRGRIELLTNEGQLTIINNIDFDEYLYSVLPSEMPASWNIEALKAQAVASRTYMLSNMNKHSQNGYNLCSTTHCQAYNGISSENEQTTSAVEATKGICAYYNGELINAVFSASSGGYTSNAEDVWSGEAVPYLTGVKDTFDVENITWQRSFTLNEISNMAGNIGSVYNVILKSGAKSGRVKEMILEGTSGKKTIKGDSIRTFFSSSGGSLKSTRFAFSQSSLPIVAQNNNAVSGNIQEEKQISVISATDTNSVNLSQISILNKDNEITKNSSPSVIDEKFVISPINTEDAEVIAESSVINNADTSQNESLNTTSSSSQTITFYGYGFGHGVGMSQYGANKMAQLGYNYKQILEYYYKGITIK